VSAAAAPAVAGLLLALAAGCGGDSRTPLVVYSPHGRDLLELYEREFERAQPALDVRWLDMGSQEVYDRVRSERANPQADVWFGGPDAILARAAAEGLLAPYRPEWAAAVPETSRGEGDLYFGTFLTVPVLVWNAKLVAAEDAPRDWDDLLAPRFAGRLLVRDPLASGVLRTLFAWKLAESVGATGSTAAGRLWLARLDAQTKEYVANPALLFEKLARGEGLVTAWELTDILLHRAAGDPVGYAFPRSGTPVIDDAAALVARAPHRAAAVAFLDWIGSAAAQRLAAERVYRIPARTDLARATLPEWARTALAELSPARYDEALAARSAAQWMADWDATIRGRGAELVAAAAAGAGRAAAPAR
jgi:iron(III) transport system substrate-binding protein